MFEFTFLTPIGNRTYTYNSLDEGDLDAICFNWEILDIREEVCL